MKTYFNFSIVLLSLLFVSCDIGNEENECITMRKEFVTSVNAPATAMVNQTVHVAVNFRVYNGCGQFSRFIESTNGNETTIEVQAIYDGCFCTQDAPIRSTNYLFTPTATGSYVLKFKLSATDFITTTIAVN